MAQPFSFPPPPPPPPKSIQQNYNLGQQPFRESNRGRGNFSPPYNNRGRGSSNRGNYSRGSNQQHQRGSYQNRNTHSLEQTNGYGATSAHQHAGQKRDHRQAFQQQQNGQAHRNSRPLAPPPVPSFGVDFTNLLPKKPEPPAAQIAPSPPLKKSNLLGLTPAKQEDDSSDDEGEESKLAQSTTGIQFEYAGNTATLSTPEDIAAWIAERRKRWPTQQKRDQAQKEAEIQAKKREEERTARQEAGRAAAKARQEKWEKQKLEKEKSQVRQKMLREQIARAKIVGAQGDAQVKAEKLRRKAEKIARQLKVAEHALEERDEKKDGDDADLEKLLDQVDRAAAMQELKQDVDLDGEMSSNSSDEEMADDTSSSGSSDSETDLDAAPEELSSKRDGPEKVIQNARKGIPGTDTDTRPLCTNFAKFGRCKFGRKCRYKHPRQDRKVQTAQHSQNTKRKGLYQIMVEKEQEEERRRALKAIIALGDAGMLDEKPAETQEHIAS